jgi:hypothetical protein
MRSKNESHIKKVEQIFCLINECLSHVNIHFNFCKNISKQFAKYLIIDQKIKRINITKKKKFKPDVGVGQQWMGRQLLARHRQQSPLYTYPNRCQ